MAARESAGVIGAHDGTWTHTAWKRTSGSFGGRCATLTRLRLLFRRRGLAARFGGDALGEAV
jgi:hypothetical protein